MQRPSPMAALGLALAIAAPAHAQTIVYGSFVQPSAAYISDGTIPWFKEVSRLTDGAVKLDLQAGGAVVTGETALSSVETGIVDGAAIGQLFSAVPTKTGFPSLSASRDATSHNDPTFLRVDPPEHDLCRRMVTKEFMVRNITAMKPRLAAMVDDLLRAMITGANQDPAVSPGPNRFDIMRDTTRHIAFSFGSHQCLGQNLARAELETVFSTIFDRLPNLRLAADALKFKTESIVMGVESLPLVRD